MKKITVLIFLFCGFSFFAQNSGENQQYALDINYFYGNIAEHTPDISHLITGHPEGLILGFSQKTFGDRAWEARYNYPDLGFSVAYQNLKNEFLGENLGLYGHMNFYFLNRNMMLRIGQGLGYASNPYHPEQNPLNNAYGSRILSSTYLMANVKKENLFKGFGVQAGFALIHYSNADFKSPNSSTNSVTLNLGFNYLLHHENMPQYRQVQEEESFRQAVRFNFAFRSGVNTTGITGSKQYPFLTFSAFADKVVSNKSTLQLGTELFLSKAMKERIRYESVVSPLETSGDEDSKRMGAFVGHQLVFYKLSVITQLGYYLYFPYEHFVGRVYNRIGLQREISDNFWGSVTVRSHWNNAEAVEFSLGYRL